MKAVKVLFAVLAAITALLVIAAVLIASLFDPNDYKGVVTDAFAARTGRTLTIERDLELSFFPWLAVETGGITIGSAADFGGATTPFATAERAAARVKLLPLLGRRVEIGTVELDGLQLALARDAELRGNWEDVLATANAAPAATSNARAEPGTAGVEGFALEGLRIRNGSISWRENTNELRYTVSNLNFSTGSIGGSNTPVDVDASFDFRDELTGLMVALQASAAAQVGANGSITATKLDAEVTLHTANDAPAREFGATAASIVFDRDAQTLQVEGLTTVIAGARAAWRLQGTALLDNPSLQGNVSIAGAPLGGVLEALEWQPPQGVQARDLGEFTLTTDFSFRAEPLEIRVTGVDGQVLGARVRGEGTLAGSDFQGHVDIPEFTPNAVVRSLVSANVPATIDVSALGNLALSTQFGFRAQPREIRVTGVDAQLFGMRVRGEGTLAGDNDLKGRIDIPEFTPNAAVQSLLRASIPPTVDVSALGKLALATRFDANLATGRAALRELKAGAFGASITGELEAIPGTNGNTFQGSVATSRFAPDAFAKAFAALLPANLSPGELGMLQVNTRFVFDSGKDTVTVAPLRAELFGLQASGEVTGRNVATAANWTGSAQIAQFSPQDLIRRFGLPPQPTSDDKALTRATIDARFEVDKNQARLSNVSLALDDSKITGDFTVAGFDDPQYRFTLLVDRVDADRYLPPKARDAQAGEATAGDIELPQNNTMRLDGTMQVGTLGLAGMQFQDVGSRIVIGGGDAKLEGARARLYGGEFNGNFHVRAAGNTPGLALDGRASGLQLQPLIEALTGEAANFSGTGNFDLNLAGSGRTVIQNVQSAGGNVSFAMRDGAIKGFNLGSTLCSAYNATQGAGGPRGEQPKQTSYEVIQGTATVTAGTAQSPDLLARTSFMDIVGRGSLGLVEQRLNYDLDAKLTGKIAIAGCETMDGLIGDAIPFNIRGTVTAPTITPDFSKLVQRRIREEVQDRLQERIQDRLRGILR